MQPPEQIGPYVIIRKIGTGGMGDVFEARHGAIERRVAIKVLRKTDGQTADFNKRFINEARAVNIVEHPGIVQIFDHGQLPDGTSYIVMEYLHGVTLTTHMKSGLGRLPLEDILRISRQLASVLAAAHAKGIIHREQFPTSQQWLTSILPRWNQQGTKPLREGGHDVLVTAARSRCLRNAQLRLAEIPTL